MADNYLEKKMEEYRAGACRRPEHRTPSGNKPHTAVMPCALRGAFVIGEERLSPLLRACAVALRGTACRTAFCCTDRASGTADAQASGLQYYPVGDTMPESVGNAVEKASEAYGGIDVLVYEDSGKLYVDVSGRQSVISPAETCPADVFASVAPRMIIYLSLPQSNDLNLCGHFSVSADGHLSIVED